MVNFTGLEYLDLGREFIQNYFAGSLEIALLIFVMFCFILLLFTEARKELVVGIISVLIFGLAMYLPKWYGIVALIIIGIFFGIMILRLAKQE